jgi:hypothetical protein
MEWKHHVHCEPSLQMMILNWQMVQKHFILGSLLTSNNKQATGGNDVMCTIAQATATALVYILLALEVVQCGK